MYMTMWRFGFLVAHVVKSVRLELLDAVWCCPIVMFGGLRLMSGHISFAFCVLVEIVERELLESR